MQRKGNDGIFNFQRSKKNHEISRRLFPDPFQRYSSGKELLKALENLTIS